jgi:hypothetical protein
VGGRAASQLNGDGEGDELLSLRIILDTMYVCVCVWVGHKSLEEVEVGD